MNAAFIIFLEIIAPLFILIVVGRFKMARRRRKAAADEAAGVNLHPPFDPKPEPASGLFPRPFSVPQRAYLRQQIALGKGFYYISAWGFIVFFTSGLLPQYVNRYGSNQPLAQRVWYSYLLHISIVQVVFGIMMVMSVLVAVSGLTGTAQAIFNRTRPLTQSFLFWARIVPAIATILIALITGMAVSFVLLLAFYGPVWLHLFDAAKSLNGSLVMTGISEEQASHLARMLQTSTPRLFLSLTTTSLLIFSFATVIVSQPFNFLRKRAAMSVMLPLMIFAGVIGSEIAHFLGGPMFARWSRALFMYTTLGPPPPYVHALLPVLISAALLYLAAFCIRRVEP